MSAAGARSLGGRLLRALGIVVAALVIIAAGSWLWFWLNPVTIVEPAPAPLSILTQPIADGPNAALLRRGRYLVIAGDCVSCHTRAGARPFTGGLGLQTPFGTIYSPNLTGDSATGIGNWTPDQFFRALHDGVAPGGKHLYPAFPYTHFSIVSRGDSDAMLAWLKTVPAEPYDKPANRLPFPLDIRLGMIGWNWLNFAPHAFQPDPHQSALWNRGAYLVEGLEHCGACHTPRTTLGADDAARAYQGGNLDHQVAPDLTGNPRTGLARWSLQDVAEYLKTGRNMHSNAGGQMAEVVSYSTSLLTDRDRLAIATYIKSLRSGPSQPVVAADPAAMRTGAAIYADACTACHRVSGQGEPRMFPPLAGSAAAQQADPTGLIRMILAGARTGPTLTSPTAQAMPSFAWKLDDQQVADVATYVRNSWGNAASGVQPRQVAKLRKALQLRAPLARL